MSSASSKTPASSSEWVGALVERSWKPAVVVAIAIGVGVVFFMIWGPAQARIDDRSTQRAERAESIYAAWQRAGDELARVTLAQQLQIEVSQILDEFSNRYAASRARFIRAAFYFETGDWQRAAEDWLVVANGGRRSYLGGLALFNAAVAAEEAGSLDAARERFEQVVADYDDTPLPPRALFALGRVSEGRGEFPAARAAYEQLEQLFPSSDWATLARNRLIALKIDGLLEG